MLAHQFPICSVVKQNMILHSWYLQSMILMRRQILTKNITHINENIRGEALGDSWKKGNYLAAICWKILFAICQKITSAICWIKLFAIYQKILFDGEHDVPHSLSELPYGLGFANFLEIKWSPKSFYAIFYWAFASIWIHKRVLCNPNSDRQIFGGLDKWIDIGARQQALARFCA